MKTLLHVAKYHRYMNSKNLGNLATAIMSFQTFISGQLITDSAFKKKHLTLNKQIRVTENVAMPTK